MVLVTENEIASTSRKAIEALYGQNIQDFNVRVVFPYSTDPILDRSNATSSRMDAWDVQVTFLMNGIQYTVDLIIHKEDGQISHAKLIDKMTPL
jgi:hypothetical protein